MACSASCTVLLLTGNVCGDGVVDVAHEACDDRNTSACGSCNATCQMTQASAPAVGVVVCPKGMEFIDGETLTLNDGVNAPTVFEFDFGGGVAGGHVAIALTSGDGSSTVGSQVKTKINAIGAGLAITATNSSGTVNLTNDRASVAGNAPIIETVVTPNFTVNGMSGGAGGDCPSGTGCKTNNDCVSGVCGAGSTCQ
jgi:cysteine-rich repeat protein